MAKRTKKLSRSSLKLEALEQRQLLAGVTGAGTEVGTDIHHANGNVYDQVKMTGSSVTVTADQGQITRVSFLDLNGDIVQAEFSGAGSLTISLDQFTKDASPTGYVQDVTYSKGLASFTIQGSDASTNFSIFSVGKGNAVNQALFDATHQGGDHLADVSRLTIVANPSNPNGSDFGAIYAGNAVFSGSSGVVGITASNVQVQNTVRIGDVDASGSATPTLVFGTHSQFGSVDVQGGDLMSTNQKSVNNNNSYEYGVNLLAGGDSAGNEIPAKVAMPVFTGHDPFAGTAAKTLSLSSGNDVGSAFAGTSGDDTYIAAIGTDGIPTNGTTLNAGDALNGGGGTDTLSLSISGTNTANQTTASFTANNIEKLTIANFETSAFGSTVDLASVPNLTSVAVTSSSATGDTTLSSVQAIVAASMSNGAGDLTLNYATSVVAGTADVQALTVSGQTAGTFTANGIETLNITSNTAANTLTVAGTELKTITVAGDKGLDLGTLAGTVTKVDASGLTAGSLKVTGNTANDYNLIGGAGDDSITISTGYSNGDTVNGGAGSDTLSIGSSIAGADDLKNVSNVETLKVTGANSITLAANVGPTTFDLSDKTAQALTLTSSVTTKYTNDTTVTLTGDGGTGDSIQNSANVTLVVNAETKDISATTTIAGGTGSDTLNLVAKGGTADLAKVSGVEKINITGSDDSVINFSGGHNVDTVVASGKTLTIDGSAASAALTIDASGETNGLLSITTGSGKDTITGGSSGKDTIISGAGNDSITLGAITATNVVTGGDGTDTLTVSGTDIADAGKLVGVTGVETLKLGGSVDITLAAPITATTGISTIDISDSSDNIVTLKSGYTDATKIVLTGDTASADKIDNSGANVALTVEANVGDIGGTTTIKGGSGTDVLNLKAGNGTTATLTNVSGVETVTIVQDNDHPDYAVTVTMGANDTQIAAGKTLKVDASALTNSAAVFTFNGTSSETDGFVSVVGSAGADVISGTNSGFDTLIGGAGNDAITLGTLNATNVVSGGDGTDSLAVTTDIATSSAFLGVTGIETLKLGASTDVTLTSNITATTGITKIDASDASDNVITIASGVTDAINVVLTGDSTNADKIVNSANTSLTVTAGVADIDSTTTITGGTGTDVLNLKAAANNDAANLSAVTGVETITVAKSAGNAISITVGADTVVAAGKTLTIDASATTDAATLDGSAETNGSLILKGGSGADVFTGGGAADTFTGGDGADTFNVSKHTNKLTFDVVTDASTGDILNTSDKGTEVFGATEKVKISLGALATFSDYLDAAAAGDGSTDGIYRWFQYGGNTYLVFDVSLASTFQSNADMVIQLNGDVDLSKATLGNHQLTLG